MPRRNFTAEFKARVVLEVISGLNGSQRFVFEYLTSEGKSEGVFPTEYNQKRCPDLILPLSYLNVCRWNVLKCPLILKPPSLVCSAHCDPG